MLYDEVKGFDDEENLVAAGGSRGGITANACEAV